MAEKYHKYFCTVAVSVSSLAFIVGGIFWYIDISSEPLSYVFILPAIIILFGIGIAYTCFKVLACQYTVTKDKTSAKEK